MAQPDGTLTTRTIEICDTLNNFFSEVGSKLASEIPNMTGDPTEFVNPISSHVSLSIMPVSEVEVFEMFRKLKPFKSYGPDEIHPNFVRKIPSCVSGWVLTLKKSP